MSNLALYDIDTNENMDKALEMLYRHALYFDWIDPEHAGSHSINGSTTSALVRRGLAERNDNSVIITDNGIKYCRDVLKIAPEYKPSDYIREDVEAVRIIKHLTSKGHNIQEFITAWQREAIRLHADSVDWSFHGGYITDTEKHSKANTYRAMVNIAMSLYNN